MVCFIGFYLVFPTNFGIVFLPHKNTVILLEPYCGTITEPGLPVLKIDLFTVYDAILAGEQTRLKLQ